MFRDYLVSTNLLCGCDWNFWRKWVFMFLTLTSQLPKLVLDLKSIKTISPNHKTNSRKCKTVFPLFGISLCEFKENLEFWIFLLVYLHIWRFIQNSVDIFANNFLLCEKYVWLNLDFLLTQKLTPISVSYPI